jgi:hypothetical protein
MKFKDILFLLETEDPNKTTQDYMQEKFNSKLRQEEFEKENEEIKKAREEAFAKMSEEQKERYKKKSGAMPNVLSFLAKKILSTNEITYIIQNLSILKSMAYNKKRHHYQFMSISKEEIPISVKYSTTKKRNYVNKEMRYEIRQKITNELRSLMNKYISLIQNKDEEFYKVVTNLKIGLDNL